MIQRYSLQLNLSQLYCEAITGKRNVSVLQVNTDTD